MLNIRTGYRIESCNNVNKIENGKTNYSPLLLSAFLTGCTIYIFILSHIDSGRVHRTPSRGARDAGGEHQRQLRQQLRRSVFYLDT